MTDFNDLLPEQSTVLATEYTAKTLAPFGTAYEEILMQVEEDITKIFGQEDDIDKAFDYDPAEIAEIIVRSTFATHAAVNSCFKNNDAGKRVNAVLQTYISLGCAVGNNYVSAQLDANMTIVWYDQLKKTLLTQLDSMNISENNSIADVAEMAAQMELVDKLQLVIKTRKAVAKDLIGLTSHYFAKLFQNKLKIKR